MRWYAVLVKCLLGLALLLLVSTPAWAKAIDGHVYIGTGAPARMARVTLSTEMGRQIDTTVTDADGRFSFTGLESKVYEVTIDLDGYRRETQEFDLSEPQELSGTFFLQPSADKKKPLGLSSPSLEAKAEQSLKQGQQLLQERRYRDAISPLTAAVAAAPNFAPGYDDLGNAYFGIHDFTNAEKEWQQAVRLNPKLASALVNLARLANDRQDARGALQYLDRAAATGDDNWPLHLERGRAFYALGDSQQQMVELNRSLTKGGGPAQPQLYVMLANAYVKTHDYPHARYMFEQYLTAEPQGSFAPRARAIVNDMVAKGIPEPPPELQTTMPSK